VGTGEEETEGGKQNPTRGNNPGKAKWPKDWRVKEEVLKPM